MSIETAQEPEILPASAADIPFFRETAAPLLLDAEDLSPEQFLTARRNGRIIGYGRIRPYPSAHELDRLTFLEEGPPEGWRKELVAELIRRFPQDEIYVTSDRPEFFEALGFLRTDILPPELEAKARSNRLVGLVYDRVIERYPTLADVYHARQIIERHLPRTPLLRNVYLSNLLQCEAYLKLENLLPIGAFKVRGGVYLAATLDEEERQRGIVGASTGNHGQSLAYGAKLMGAPCVIAMPRAANPLKVEAIHALGADVRFEGSNFEEARTWAETFAAEQGMRYIHHSNSPALITGVATMSLEIVEDLPDVDVIVVPIGGGSAAIGHCLVAKTLRPHVQVIGVQAEGAQAVYRSWRDRRLRSLPINTAAEGLATGRSYYAPIRTFIERLDDFVVVSEEEIWDAIALLVRSAHQVAEHSGATATAAAVKLRDQLRGKKVAIIVSGGNLTVEGLRLVLDKAREPAPGSS